MKMRWLNICMLVGCLIAWGAGHKAWSQDQSSQQYRLNPGDLLQITVLDEPELSGEVLVGPDGFLRLPLIGSVMAAGLTLDELTARLEKALGEYLREPRITVAIKGFSPSARRVYVLGAVKAPGAYALPIGIASTVVDAITLAGGFGDNADLERVRVFSNGQVRVLDLRSLQSGNLTGVDGWKVQPGDLVWVPPAFHRVSIVGAVANGGIHPVPTRASLLEALAIAGGVQEPTATVRVLRGGAELVSVPWSQLLAGDFPPMTLQEGDVVLVSVKQVSGILVTGAVSRPGLFDIKGAKATLLGALAMAGAGSDLRPIRVRVLRQGQEWFQTRYDPSAGTPTTELSQELQSGDVVLVEPLLLRATLLGPVSKPGTHTLPSGSRVLDLLAQGEGTLPEADLMNATLIRKGETRQVNLLKLLWEGEMEANVELQDGDILMLPVSRKVWVVGAVQRPGTLDYQPRMSVMDAIAAAGGPRSMEEADLSAVRIIRGEEARTVNLEAASSGESLPTEWIKPGDVVVVPERAKAYIYGAVVRPGPIGVREGDTVLTLLSRSGPTMPNAKLSDAILIRFVNNKAVAAKVDLERAQKGDLSQTPVVQPGDILYIPSRKQSQWNLERVLGTTLGLATTLYWLRQL